MSRQTNESPPFAGRMPPERLAGAPRIWAVGGGKGGVGKSVVASGLAAAMAGAGRRCTLIDADLGGANLHTLLGVPRPTRTLSNFLSGEVKALADLMVPTSISNLSLVSGNQALLEMANPKHCQKEKLFRHIRGLDTDEVLVDVGAGSAFNVIDTFLVARRGLMVITPEPTAIENAQHFLKAAFYRSLRIVGRRPDVRCAMLRLKEDRRRPPVRSAQELVACIKKIDPSAAKLLAECAEAFAPMLVVNRAETAEHRDVGPALAARCLERHGVSMEYLGFLDTDPHVVEAVARQQPAYQLFARSAFSRQIDALAKRLLREDCDASPEPGERGSRALGRTLRGGDGTCPPVPAHRAPSLPALDLSAPGEYLRRCRQHLGLTLREMIERTRIQVLAHIEGERFESLPPEPYLRGFVLQYARELGVSDLEALTNSYLDRHRKAAAT